MSLLIKNKGHLNSYLHIVVFLFGGMVFLYLMFLALDPILLDLYDSRDSGLINNYRTIGAKVWRMLYRFDKYPFLLIAPCLMLISVYIAQIGLSNKKARILNIVCATFVVLLIIFSFFSFFHLLVTPFGFERKIL